MDEFIDSRDDIIDNKKRKLEIIIDKDDNTQGISKLIRKPIKEIERLVYSSVYQEDLPSVDTDLNYIRGYSEFIIKIRVATYGRYPNINSLDDNIIEFICLKLIQSVSEFQGFYYILPYRLISKKWNSIIKEKLNYYWYILLNKLTICLPDYTRPIYVSCKTRKKEMDMGAEKGFFYLNDIIHYFYINIRNDLLAKVLLEKTDINAMFCYITDKTCLIHKSYHRTKCPKTVKSKNESIIVKDFKYVNDTPYSELSLYVGNKFIDKIEGDEKWATISHRDIEYAPNVIIDSYINKLYETLEKENLNLIFDKYICGDPKCDHKIFLNRLNR